MTKITIDIAAETAKAAREAGLLRPQVLEQQLVDALRRWQAADVLLSVADRVAVGRSAPMSMEEINAEVKAARIDRRKNASGH